LLSRHAAIYDEHSLSELLMTAFTIYKPSLLSAAIACLFPQAFRRQLATLRADEQRSLGTAVSIGAPLD
jgi:hypothetical protein